MTLGQKLKKLRTEKRLTQKDLTDRLHVTFQTVSKWQSDTNEPDFSTLKELSKILDYSIEYLFSDNEPSVEAEDSTPEVEEVPVVPARTKIGVCRDCRKELFGDDLVYTVERKSAGGIKEMVTVCDECFKKHEDGINRRAKEIEDSMKPAPKKVGTGPFHKITDRNDSKPLIWSIRFPGLIFTWDLEGFTWLIAMKILFFALSVMYGVFVFLLALSLSALLSFSCSFHYSSTIKHIIKEAL